jgi:outer membrane autotransporter protein
MSYIHYPFTLPTLAVGIALAFDGIDPAAARVLTGPDQSEVVSPDDTPENWTLRNGAQLEIQGGSSLAIRAAGSTVTLANATVSGGASTALTISQGSAAIRNSTLTSDRAAAINANNGTAGLGAKVTVVDSVLTGTGRGVNVTYASEINLRNTQVTGHASGGGGVGAQGLGAGVFGGTLNASEGSYLYGAQRGVLLSSDTRPDAQAGIATLQIDNAHVEGGTGAAIAVEATGSPVNAEILVQNGATLKGGNGVILEAGADTQAAFTAANTALNGNIHIAEGSTTRITLKDNARLTGNMTGVAALAIHSGAQWRMTQSAAIGNLELNDGHIDLGGSSGDFRELTLDRLDGHGSFALGTDLAAGEGDRLVIKGEVSGNHLLAIKNTGTDVAQGQAPLTVVQTGGGTGQFGVIGGQVDLGTFVYDLKRIGDQWQLVQRPGDVVAPGTRSVLGLFSAAPSVWYGELSSLQGRMGEWRSGFGQSGLWSRAYGSKLDLSAAAGVSYRQTQQGFSLGADAPVPVATGQALVGVQAGYSQADLDLQAGTSGKVDSYHIGVYATWLADDGHYLDALAKLNRFQNASQVRMSDGAQASGDYDHFGLGLSVETGRRIALTDAVAVTPFTQLSVLKVQGQQYRLDNGMRASSNHADSALGKAGARISQKVTLRAGGTLELHAKAALAHEFVSSNRVKVNGNAFNNDLSGGRGELGVGVALQVAERVQAHAEFDYAKGRKLEQPWGLNLGLRYNF